jgi:hypothetical protein
VRGDLKLVKEYFQAGGLPEIARRAKGRVLRVTGRTTT